MNDLSVENSLFAFLIEEMKQPKCDLSEAIADIHISAFCLERIEPGLWWDVATGRPRLLHPNISHWMAHYGFSSVGEMPAAAVIVFRDSLRKRLELMQKGVIDVS